MSQPRSWYRRTLPPLFIMVLASCGSGSKRGAPPSSPVVQIAKDEAHTQVPPRAKASSEGLIDPYVSCAEDTPAEKVCTVVEVGGSTVLGHAYPAALCPDVRRLGRPFHPVPVPHRSQADDQRLNDPAFMRELTWVTSQIKSSACVCCHDTATDQHAAMWDIGADSIWTDQLTPRGVAILGGVLNSNIFGDIPATKNNGFDRSGTGAPTTDKARMRQFFQSDMARRGITPADVAKMRPLAF